MKTLFTGKISLPRIWNVLSTLALATFVASVCRHLPEVSYQVGLLEVMICLSYLFTHILFWAGDRALSLLSSSPDVKKMSRKMVIPDIIAVSLQALIFIAMAAFLLENHDAYLRLLLALTSINMGWLTMKLFQFFRFLDGEKPTHPAFRARMIQARNAMLTWNGLNGVYLMISVAVLSLTLHPEMTRYTLVSLAIARSIADLILCYAFYTDCFDGAFGDSLGLDDEK
jgi:hypothetical protein